MTRCCRKSVNDDAVKQPIETFEHIYRHLGWSLDGGIRVQPEAYGGNNAPGAFGAHKYEAEDYGLTRACQIASGRGIVEVKIGLELLAEGTEI